MLNINQTDTQKRREAIDKIVDEIIARFRKMMGQNIPVETAIRLAISWELEVQILTEYTKFQEELLKLKDEPKLKV